MTCRHHLPGFRATCVGIGVTQVLLAGSVLVRGTAAAMAGYGVPDETLASAHYDDAIVWVYVHMTVLGVLIALVGWVATGAQLKRAFARTLLAAHLVYLFLDTRTSDTPLGNGLYEGAASAFPALIALVMTLLLAHTSFCSDTT